MADDIIIDKAAPKALKYEQLLPQIEALIGDETDEHAVLASVAAALHYGMGFFWTGFYKVDNNDLVVGPYQGPVACLRIQYGKGVCGSAWKLAETIVVPDVTEFPGHISCSAESLSEIVVPLMDKNAEVRAILDVDSNHLNAFDKTDKEYLEQLAAWLSSRLY